MSYYEMLPIDNKRFQQWGGKRKREVQKNFKIWSGKRDRGQSDVADNYTPWMGKRSKPFDIWHGKRSKFDKWTGKRSSMRVTAKQEPMNVRESSFVDMSFKPLEDEQIVKDNDTHAVLFSE